MHLQRAEFADVGQSSLAGVVVVVVFWVPEQWWLSCQQV